MDCQVEDRDESHGDIDPEIVTKHSSILIHTSCEHVNGNDATVAVSTVAQPAREKQPDAHKQRKSIAEKVRGIEREASIGRLVVHQEKIEVHGETGDPQHGANRGEVQEKRLPGAESLDIVTLRSVIYGTGGVIGDVVSVEVDRGPDKLAQRRTEVHQ